MVFGSLSRFLGVSAERSQTPTGVSADFLIEKTIQVESSSSTQDIQNDSQVTFSAIVTELTHAVQSGTMQNQLHARGIDVTVAANR